MNRSWIKEIVLALLKADIKVEKDIRPKKKEKEIRQSKDKLWKRNSKATFPYYHVPLKLTIHHTIRTKREKKLMKIL